MRDEVNFFDLGSEVFNDLAQRNRMLGDFGPGTCVGDIDCQLARLLFDELTN